MKHIFLIFICLFLLLPSFCLASESLDDLEKELSDLKKEREILESNLAEIERGTGFEGIDENNEYDILPEKDKHIEVEQPESKNYKGQIIEVKKEAVNAIEKMPEEIRDIVPVQEDKEVEFLTVNILNKDKKGEVVSIENNLRGNPYNLDFKKGDKVFINVLKYNSQPDLYVIKDFYHLDWLFIWLVIFVLCVLLIGSKKGVLALLSLGISIPLVFLVFLPLVKKGYDPIILTLVICTVITIISLFIITGFTRKTVIAILGTLSGILFVTILVLLIGWLTRLTGLSSETNRIIAVSFPDLNFKYIYYSGVVIGALGAVMDIAVSIASSQKEIINHKYEISRKELVKSGLNVGRDVLGSMINTLIFAYIGTSLAMVLVLSESEMSLLEILNMGFISEEIVRSMVGTFGLLVVIPLTALFGGVIYSVKRKKNNN